MATRRCSSYNNLLSRLHQLSTTRCRYPLLRRNLLPTVIADVTGIQDAKCVSGTQTVFHLPKRAEEPECKLPAEAASDPDSEQELVPHAGNGSAPLNYAEIAPDDKEPVQPSSVRGVVLACCQPLTDDFT